MVSVDARITLPSLTEVCDGLLYTGNESFRRLEVVSPWRPPPLTCSRGLIVVIPNLFRERRTR